MEIEYFSIELIQIVYISSWTFWRIRYHFRPNITYNLAEMQYVFRTKYYLQLRELLTVAEG